MIEIRCEEHLEEAIARLEKRKGVRVTRTSPTTALVEGIRRSWLTRSVGRVPGLAYRPYRPGQGPGGCWWVEPESLPADDWLFTGGPILAFKQATNA